MKIDPDEIDQAIDERKKTDRRKHSFYVSDSICAQFSSACKPKAASPVLEELMRRYIQAKKKPRTRAE